MAHRAIENLSSSEGLSPGSKALSHIATLQAGHKHELRTRNASSGRLPYFLGIINCCHTSSELWAAVPLYRIYSIKDGHFAGPPVVVECSNDEQALAKAWGQLDKQDIELWQLDRLVTRLKAPDFKKR